VSSRALSIASLVLISAGLAACGPNPTPLTSGRIAPILLFNGTGTSHGDVAALETVLNAGRLDYSKVNSSQLNRMSDSQIRGYRLLIVPGGNFIDIGNGLAAGATSNIRSAVQNGLNYLGICAGAFFAGDSGYNGLNLTSGVRFGFYSAEARGIRKAAVAIAAPGGAAALDQYWEDGPELTGWGAVVARYPDGTPAVVQGTFGSGWVLLTGVHPEAPAAWRRGLSLTTPASVDNAYAENLIRAALNRTSLPHY